MSDRLLDAMDDRPQMPTSAQTYNLPQVGDRRRKPAPNAIVPADDRDGVYIFKGCELSTLGLLIPDTITEQDFQELGLRLLELEDRMSLWIGDWLVQADLRWGITYEQVAEVTGRKPKTLRNWKYVCGKVDLSLRRDNLEFGHYSVVAGMEPDNQGYWLNCASENTWTVAQLTNEIKQRPTLTAVERFAGLLNQNRQKYQGFAKLVDKGKVAQGERLQISQMIDQQIEELRILKDSLNS